MADEREVLEEGRVEQMKFRWSLGRGVISAIVIDISHGPRGE